MPKHSFVYERNRQDQEPQIERRRLDVPQTAQRLQVSRRTVYRLIDSGELLAVKMGTERSTQVLESSIEDYERKKAQEAGL